MSIYGAVELGGTKTLVAVGTEDGEILESERFETGEEPAVTSRRVVEFLSGRPIEAIGISAFGPLELRRGHPRYGSVLDTPKPGWKGHNLIRSIGEALQVPVEIETDVNGAAIAEGEWGAAQGLQHHAYMTVGTGIGVGIVVGGALVHGVSHPEFGHIAVARHPDDGFAGSCPYHGDCLEGMASGVAVEARFGAPISEISGESDVPPVELVAHYVAQGLRTLVYSTSPQRVVIGGGVSKSRGFHAAVRASLLQQLVGYGVLDLHRRDDFVVPPGLGDRSGLVGALLLAKRAAIS